METPGAESEGLTWLSSTALLSDCLDELMYMLGSWGKGCYVTITKSSQSSIKILSHPHIACRWFVYSPQWILHPEIALHVFCTQSTGISINRTRHKSLFQAIHYSLPFSAFGITGKAVGGGLRKVPNRPTLSTYQGLTCRLSARLPLLFLPVFARCCDSIAK